MRKSTSLVLFLIIFLSSCSKPCHQWKLAAIKANCPPASYVKAYLPACNPFDGLEAELLCRNGEMRLYLNAFTLLLPCEADDPNYTIVTVTICDQTYKYMTERLQGGQRLVFAEEDSQQIICELLEGNEVEISVGRYYSRLISEGFAMTYDKLISSAYP